jgi:acetyl esterase/lipase
MAIETTYPPPPFDRELQVVLAARQMPPGVDVETMKAMRVRPPEATVDDLLVGWDVTRQDRSIPGLGADPDITVSIFRKRTGGSGGPGIYFAHGGGMVLGDRFTGIDRILGWVEEFDAVAVSVEYRLAPEHADPAPVSDCYAGLLWTAAQAQELGFDPDRLIAVGLSAGGGLVAGATLMARDRGAPALAAQILICPMLDDRNQTISSRQIQGIGVWDRSSNQVGWDALLGERRGTDQVGVYSAPARATELPGGLGNLPPTFLDCGSAEVFRDEVVAYASAIWAAGGVADLHVWAGGFHAFDGFAPTAVVSTAAITARTEFVRRILTFAEID